MAKRWPKLAAALTTFAILLGCNTSPPGGPSTTKHSNGANKAFLASIPGYGDYQEPVCTPSPTMSPTPTPTPTPVPLPCTLAYVVNVVTSNVSVFDYTTNTSVATLSVGISPVDVAVAPNNTRVYVTNSGDSTVSVFDGNNMPIATIPIAGTPLEVAVTPDSTRAYVTVFEGTVVVVDTATNTVINTIMGFNQPRPIDITPDGTKAYVGNQGDNTVQVINLPADTLGATIPVGNSPIDHGIEITPNGLFVYVSINSFFIPVISTVTDTAVDDVAVPQVPFGKAFLPNSLTGWVTHANADSISQFDTTTNAVTTTFGSAGSSPIDADITPDGTRLWVANGNSDWISIFDTATNTLVATVSTGDLPNAIDMKVCP